MQKEIRTARQRKELQRWYLIHRIQGKTTPGIRNQQWLRKKLESTGQAQELERKHTKMIQMNCQEGGAYCANTAPIGQIQMNTEVQTKTCNPTQNKLWICNITHLQIILT